jgi:hypothetical protein
MERRKSGRGEGRKGANKGNRDGERVSERERDKSQIVQTSNNITSAQLVGRCVWRGRRKRRQGDRE